MPSEICLMPTVRRVKRLSALPSLRYNVISSNHQRSN
nr:MAG TPA: hypothetical protein [Caudoviricetes sp.]